MKFASSFELLFQFQFINNNILMQEGRKNFTFSLIEVQHWLFLRAEYIEMLP